METLRIFALAFSGATIVSSIILSQIGFTKSSLSYRCAILFAAIGVGVGVGLFIYFGVGEGDTMGSVFTGIISALVTSVVISITLRRKR